MDLLNNAQVFCVLCNSFVVLLSALADHLNLSFRKCGLWVGAGSEAKLLLKVDGFIPGCCKFRFHKVRRVN